jgi:serine/threonine protein kinase
MIEKGTERWHVVTASAFPHEQEALNVLREGLPSVPPFRGWSNFEFIAEDGSINEVDALVLSSDRLYLIEIKSWRGAIGGSQHTWTIRNGNRERAEENPLLLANRKAKKLKSLLGRTKAFKSFSVPYVQAAVFLSSTECTVMLDEVSGQHVYLRPDGQRKGRRSILDLVSGVVTRTEGRPTIGRDLERALCRAMDELGLHRRSSSAEVGDYKLTRLIFENDRYQDWEATHARLESDRRRVRIFPHGKKAAVAEKEERKDLALREFRLMGQIQHAGILRPIQLTECEVGPALVYDLHPNTVRFDHFLESGLSALTIDRRLELIRAIAEALQYAHKQGIQHRALSPWTIDIAPEADGSLRPEIRDWQVASASGDGRTATRMTLHVGSHAGLLIDERALVYAAPETLAGNAIDGIALDVFALGAISYAIFSGQHPAGSPEELLAKCKAGPGLRLSGVVDGVQDKLEELIQFATDVNPTDRPADVRDFLKLLDDVEDKITEPEPKLGVHPRDAKKDDQLSEGFRVIQRLGSGSTSFALAVEKDGQIGVLKIAKEPALNERVRAEGEVLKELNHPNIVRYFGLFEIDGLAALFIEQAGDRTLGQRLHTEGALSVDLLDRFGDELLNALIHLEREGINHRDIKPENIGIGQNRQRALTLKLFDFSLSKTPAENIRAGTVPYLDPYLNARKPPRWDLSAERYAAAATLYELATGNTPVGGKEDSAAEDGELRLDTTSFDPALREPLERFFLTALAHDYKLRFDNAEEMHQEWRSIFRQRDATTTDDTGQNEELIDLSAVEDIGVHMRLSLLGLSPRILNAAERMGAGTVGELLNLPGIRFYRNRGIGQRVTRYLRRLRDELAEQVAGKDGVVQDSLETPESISVDRLAQSLASIKLSDADLSALKIWLGLEGGLVGSGELPTIRDAAEAAAVSRTALQENVEQAVEKWAKNKGMTVLRDEIADFVVRREGAVTVAELCSRLLGLRGSAATSSELRARRVGAVIQAAVESEVSRANARYVWHRGSSALLIVATEQLGAAFKALALERADYAYQLGKVVNELALEWPLPTQRRVDEALSNVTGPEEDQPLSPERRLRLAVAMTPKVALSSRLELYPHGLIAERALRLGSGALLGPKRLTDKQIQSRIQSRFAHAEVLPGRPALDQLLVQAEIPLVWQEAADEMPAGYAPPQRSSGLTHHSSTFRRYTTLTAHAESRGPEEQTAVLFEQTMQRALRDGRVLIVTHTVHRLLEASQELIRRFELVPISADKLLIDDMHESARQAGADWDVVLKADRAAQDSTDWRRLQALIARVLPKVRQALIEDERPLLIHNIGLLVRYGQLALLQSLRDAAMNASRPPRIILVPGDAERTAPVLDGAALPVITPADFSAMPDAWLRNKHRGVSQLPLLENIV